jgi:Gram-negative porin
MFNLGEFSMKKTLVVLAALAATTAFAQSTVTLSGKFAAGLNKAPGGVAGFNVTDGDVVFGVVEDLGGGMKAGTSMAVRVRGRGPAGVVDGRDSTIYLQGGFGRLTLGAVEAGNGIQGLGHAGAPVSLPDGYDGSVLKGVANIDMFRYDIAFGGVGVRYVRSDSITAPGAGKGVLQSNTIGLSYGNGPIAADFDYTAFTPTGNKRTRVSGSYDLGVAKIGLGYQKETAIKAEYALGVSVPVGAHSVGFVYDKSLQTKRSGYGFGGDYNFSKRTALNVSFGKVDDGTAVKSATNDNQFRIRLMHKF